VQEFLALAEQELARLDMRGKEPRQRQIDAPDLLQIHRVVQRAQALHLVLGQGERRIGPECSPFLGRENAVRRKLTLFPRKLIHRRHFHLSERLQGIHWPRDLFSASPERAVRRSSSASTSESGTPAMFITTSQ